MFIYHLFLGEIIIVIGKHVGDTFQALADWLRALHESLIASKINANEYIKATKYLFTYETLAMSDTKILLREPDGEAVEDK